MKNNRSGGEDDLTLAVEHFRVGLVVLELIGRKICCSIRTGGIHGTRWRRLTCSNRKMHWRGLRIVSSEIARPSHDIRGLS